MPDTMIERVARALCEAQGFTWEQAGDPMQSGSGEDERDGYALLARAAIAALMEPTDGMVEALLNATARGRAPFYIIRAMLTAALEETPDA
jgi:hypothetical protein